MIQSTLENVAMNVTEQQATFHLVGLKSFNGCGPNVVLIINDFAFHMGEPAARRIGNALLQAADQLGQIPNEFRDSSS